jgi:ABC-type spermidine/putrescine transport system permease subunit I
MFCQYQNIFGKPKTGAHSIRILDIAIIDVILTIVLGYIINLFYPTYSFQKILIILFILGIVLHRLFCVRTTIDKLLFG